MLDLLSRVHSEISMLNAPLDLKLYKVLGEGGVSIHGGDMQWHLPAKNEDGSWTPGEWMPPIKGRLVMCRKAYHLCEFKDMCRWAGPELYEVEYRNEIKRGKDKYAVREVRLLRQVEGWNERNLILFISDCAERFLPIFERHYPNNTRPRRAIEVARLYANGKASHEDLLAAWSDSRVAVRAVVDNNSNAAWVANFSALDSLSLCVGGSGISAWAAVSFYASTTIYNHRNDDAQWQVKRLREYLYGVAVPTFDNAPVYQ